MVSSPLFSYDSLTDNDYKFVPSAQHKLASLDQYMALNAQIVGNVGLYFACYHLSLLGWNVMPTARNARGVDVIAYNLRGTQFIGIQVKTLSKRNPVPLGTSLENLMGDYWIIINRAISDPTAFILLPQEVISLAHHGEKDGKVSYWLQPKDYDCDTFRNAWHRLPDNRDEQSGERAD